MEPPASFVRQAQRLLCFGRCSQPLCSLVWQLERITGHVSALRKSHLGFSTIFRTMVPPYIVGDSSGFLQPLTCNVKVVDYRLSPKLYANLPDGLEKAIIVLSTGLEAFTPPALSEKDLAP